MNVESINQRLVTAFEVAASRWAMPFQQDRILNEEAFDELYGLATALTYTSKQQPTIRPAIIERLEALSAILREESAHHLGSEYELELMQANLEACLARLADRETDSGPGDATGELDLEEIRSAFQQASQRWLQCVYINLAIEPAVFRDLLAFAIAFTFIFKDEPLVPKSLIGQLFGEAEFIRECTPYHQGAEFELEQLALKMEGCAWMVLTDTVAANVQWRQPKLG
jgi:hypothetical protein